MAKREFTIAIDELTYLKIDEIVKLKNEARNYPSLKTDKIILELFTKSLKEYILENEDLVHDKLENDLFQLDCQLEGKGFDVSHIFEDVSKSAKEGD